MQTPTLQIFSTFTRDILTNPEQGTTVIHPGGPALFLKQIFVEQGLPFVLHAGPVQDVLIRVEKSTEVGTVPIIPPNKRVEIEKDSPVLVSTVLNEWNPQELSSLTRSVFIDVQGFVRVPGQSGTKQCWESFAGPWIESVRCLKATEEELRYLPPESVEDQKQRLLLVTRGAHGVDVFAQGKLMSFTPSRVVSSSNTVGAGDTFFGQVVCGLLQQTPLEVCVVEAMEKTILFLEKKS